MNKCKRFKYAHIYKPSHASLLTRGGWIQSLYRLLMHWWAGPPFLLALKNSTTRLFAIKMQLRLTSILLCILTIAWCCVELYASPLRLTGLFICRTHTHTPITWGAAWLHSRIRKFELTQLNLVEQTEIEEWNLMGHNCIHTHLHTVALQQHTYGDNRIHSNGYNSESLWRRGSILRKQRQEALLKHLRSNDIKTGKIDVWGRTDTHEGQQGLSVKIGTNRIILESGC